MRTASPLSLLILAALCLSGCATGGHAHWWSPGTWFSHREANAADKATAKQDAAQNIAIKAAQKAVHETAEALAEAPTSRPVTVAVDSNSEAMALLDQATGALPASELAKVRARVAGLLSENAEIRAEAEKDRAKERANSAEISRKLAKADARVATTARELRDAFERENALANEYRNLQAMFWIAVVAVAILAGLGFYVRLQLGGVGEALHALGMPSHFATAINERTSALGQWFMRTGREAAAKAAAAAAVHFESPPTSKS